MNKMKWLANFKKGFNDFAEPFGVIVRQILVVAIMWIAFLVPTVWIFKHI